MSKKERIRKRLLKSWTKIACGIRYKYAATEESIPPDIPTMTFFMVREYHISPTLSIMGIGE